MLYPVDPGDSKKGYPYACDEFVMISWRLF